MTASPDFEIFDADNHLYESEDALTRHLPTEHRNLFRFVEMNGRKKLVVRERLTEFIPNPTFEVIARPGAHMAFYAGENDRGADAARADRRAHGVHPGVPRARPAARAARRAGHPGHADVPDARQPDRGASASTTRT